MKPLALGLTLAFLILTAVVGILLALNAMDRQIPTTRVRSDAATSINPEWEGNLLDQKGRFMNDEFPYLPRSIDLFKWKLIQGNEFKKAKSDDDRRTQVLDPTTFLASNDDGIMWLGHASFFIRIDGVSIITDPVFGDPTILKRLVPIPSPLAHIRSLDLVVISHDHRDHLDEQTIRDLAVKFPNAKFVAGLRSDDVLREWAPANPVETLGWFQQTTSTKNVKLSFVPLRHWSRRGLLDTNWRLWGGFVIEGSRRKIYFGGDSGYGRHYREVGRLIPNIDYFLIGIGAYEPRWFMEPNHNTPTEALEAFADIGASTLIPMHYATFDLSDEPPGEPLERLMIEASASGIGEKVKPLAIFQSMPLER